MTNYDVRIGNHYDHYLNEKCRGGPFEGDEYIRCELSGRYLTVHSNTSGYLSICEVEAYSS